MFLINYFIDEQINYTRVKFVHMHGKIKKKNYNHTYIYIYMDGTIKKYYN